jgi:hypothetical protein
MRSATRRPGREAPRTHRARARPLRRRSWRRQAWPRQRRLASLLRHRRPGANMFLYYLSNSDQANHVIGECRINRYDILLRMMHKTWHENGRYVASARSVNRRQQSPSCSPPRTTFLSNLYTLLYHRQSEPKAAHRGEFCALRDHDGFLLPPPKPNECPISSRNPHMPISV